jgi:hypothetical protein
MGSNNRFSSFVIVFPLILTAANFGCGGGSASAPPPPQPSVAITVSLSPLSATVQAGTTAQFIAAVANDLSKGRVLFCTVVR